MHCGYTSVRLLRLLPPAGRLLTVELDPLTADIGEEIILVAGFKHSQVQPGKISSLNYNIQIKDNVAHKLLFLCFCDSLQFQVLTSSSAEAIPTLRPYLEPDKGTSEGLSLVLMDHDPQQYLPDLQALEREELLSPSGCSVLLIYRNQRAEGLREIMDHIRARPDCYSIKSELQFMMEIFYRKGNTGMDR